VHLGVVLSKIHKNYCQYLFRKYCKIQASLQGVCFANHIDLAFPRTVGVGSSGADIGREVVETPSAVVLQLQCCGFGCDGEPKDDFNVQHGVCCRNCQLNKMPHTVMDDH